MKPDLHQVECWLARRKDKILTKGRNPNDLIHVLFKSARQRETTALTKTPSGWPDSSRLAGRFRVAGRRHHCCICCAVRLRFGKLLSRRDFWPRGAFGQWTKIDRFSARRGPSPEGMILIQGLDEMQTALPSELRGLRFTAWPRLEQHVLSLLQTSLLLL